MVMKLNNSMSEENAKWKQAKYLMQFLLICFSTVLVSAHLEERLTLALNEVVIFLQDEES